MKIFSADQIKFIDDFTIRNEPISSLDLMERAASKAFEWILKHYKLNNQRFVVFAGPGNNGGDGLAIARMLSRAGRSVLVFTLGIGKSRSADFASNLERLREQGSVDLHNLNEGDELPSIAQDDVLIDAIFGSGLNKPVTGYWAQLVRHLNDFVNKVIAIDIPSGLSADDISNGEVIEAAHTLTFQQPKLSFFMPESQRWLGTWKVLDIGLHPEAIEETSTPHRMLTKQIIAGSLKVRERFDHKGTFGHALLICGGYGMVGAALLSAKACLRSGVGKLTVHVPKYAYTVLQLGVPEAMVEIDEHEYWFSGREEKGLHEATAIGCGIGQNSFTCSGLESLLRKAQRPLVIDADALNIIAKNPSWLELLPPNSILTPHPGEYRRLFGKWDHSFMRLKQQIALSLRHQIIIVCKGAHTCITTPDGQVFFNTTGNPGMATAGSGDVLTGVITGMLAQGFEPVTSACLGVFLHGLAGDLAAKKVGHYALIASDIIDHLGAAICHIKPLEV
ncbi:MAG: NAD(P)H-hydrate dehydratase [Saprospiraceae bacterium]|nr:NAD(P)H-hydrate dehydratase [Saprospiraceae bacterium]